jgi:putative membrane protein
MLRISTVAAATAAALVLTLAAHPSARQTQMADRDEDFIKDAGQSSQVEIEASKLAMTKASNAEVKAYAEKLVKEHTAASAELMSLVQTKKATWTADDAGLKAKMDKHESLQKLSGSAFDKEYLEDMISDHESALARFGRQRQNGKDATVTAFAEKMIPALQEHLKMARDLRERLFKN